MASVDELSAAVGPSVNASTPGSVDPATVPPDQQWVVDEFQQALGRPPTPEELANWSKNGTPGQILTELGGGMKTVTLEGGQTVRVYTDLSHATSANPDFVFNYSNTEGDLFALPTGTPIATDRNYKKIGSKDGYDFYGNAGEQSGGALGALAKLTGINEISTIPDKVIPNEVKSGFIPIPGISDPTGTTQTFWMGDKANQEGIKSMSDLTGLDPKYLELAQQVTRVGAELTVGATAPYIAAGMEAAYQGSQTVGADQSFKKTLENSAIALAAAAGAKYIQTGSVKPGNMGAPPPATMTVNGEPVPTGDVSIDPFTAETDASLATGGGTISTEAAPASHVVVNGATGGAGEVAGGVKPPPSLTSTLAENPNVTATTIVDGNGKVIQTTFSPKVPVPDYVTPAIIVGGIQLAGAGLQYFGLQQSLKQQDKAMKEAQKANTDALKMQQEWQQAQLDAQVKMFYDQLAVEKGSSTPHESGSMYTKGTI